MVTTEPEKKKDRESLLVFGAAFVIILAVFFITLQFIGPAPPKTITLATGGKDGAYYAFGQRYAHALADQGITVKIVSTAGSGENLQRLTATDNPVDIAFVQGGVIPADKAPALRSLGSLYYEPLWLFLQPGLRIDSLSDLKGLRIAVGANGSGTAPVARQLLQDNGVTDRTAQQIDQGGTQAVNAFNAGAIDALFMVASPSSTLIRDLLNQAQTQVFSFKRADAYLRHHHYLTKVDLPKGVVDLARNLPTEGKTLLAPTANLVVREDFHPALIGLFLQEAQKIHSGGTLLSQPGRFPAPHGAAFPLDDDAKRFYRKGPPFLQRVLPFWAATLIDRLIVMIVPLLTLMIPLFKVVPPTYRWRVRRKIFRWYDQLRDLDLASAQNTSTKGATQLMEQLREIEHDVMLVAVPKSYMDAQYNLRLHIRLIQDRLERQIDRGVENDYDAADERRDL